MAETANSTVTRIPHPSDAEIGRAARDWEAVVNDLADLADVTTEIADANFSDAGDHITLTKGQVRRILFCIYEMAQRTESFRGAYYAAIDAK